MFNLSTAHGYFAIAGAITGNTAAAYNGMTLATLFEEDTDDEPMLKKLMATFDAVTAPDSVFVHGQTRKLDKMFNDGKIDYMAPPNRPHDREIIVGWRKSWGDDKEMADFDEATAKPRDGTSMAPKPRLKPETPPAPPKETPRPAPTIQRQLQGTRKGIATTGLEIKTTIASKIVVPRGMTLPPEQAKQVQRHNGQVNAKTEAMRRELRELRANRKRLETELARQKEATAAAKKKAKAMDEALKKAKITPARLEAPKPISKVGGPGKAKGPAKPKLVEEIPPGDLKPGQWLDLNGGFAEVESVRVKGKFAFVRIKLPGRKVTLPIPQENLIDAWDKRPKPSWVRGTGLDEADNLSRWAVDADSQLASAMKRAGAWEGASMKEIRALSRFNEEVAEEMLDLLTKAKLDNTVKLRGQQKLSKALSGKGSESVKLKRYMEEHGLAKTAKMSGMEEGMATEIAAEFESMRDGLRFAPKTIDDFSIVSKKRSSGNAWVEWRTRVGTGDVSRFRMGVNSRQFKTRDHARAQWEVSAREVAQGKKPFSVAARFDKDQKVLSTIRHEYGHLVDLELQRRGQGASGDALLSRGIIRLWKKRVKMLGDDMINVSRYASTKPEIEGLAEAFALAISGKWEHIPELLHQPLRLLIQAK